MQTQKQHPRAFSFEFFPPKTLAGEEKLRATWQELAKLKPKFFSVTYGAGGSTRDRTLDKPVLILPSVQVNVRGGKLPPAESNGKRYLKIPLDVL
mgnify:CR=1 FL=1